MSKKSVRVLIHVSVSGDGRCSICLIDNSHIQTLIGWLKATNIEWSPVDSIPGWANLNQDWIEFVCTVKTSWGWPHLDCLTEEQNQDLHSLLNEGKLLMMMHYKSKNGEYIPHTSFPDKDELVFVE